MCGGNTKYLKEGKLDEYVVDMAKCNQSYTFNDLLSNKIPFVHTSSILLRNIIFINGLPSCYKEAEKSFENCALRGEDFRRILHLERGSMFIFSDIFSVYRIHSEGIWQGSSNTKRCIEGAIGSNFYWKFFGDKYGDYFKKSASRSYQELMELLVIDNNLLTGVSLRKKELELVVSLFYDVQCYTTSKKEISRFKRRICKILLRVIKVILK